MSRRSFFSNPGGGSYDLAGDAIAVFQRELIGKRVD